MPGRKKKRRQCGNKEKKSHLLKVLEYAVGNMETLQSETGRCKLRAFARTLHLTGIGVRVRYDVLHGEGDEVVVSFVQLTKWSDLLTPDEWAKGEAMLSAHAAKADRRRQLGFEVSTSPAAPLGLMPCHPNEPMIFFTPHLSALATLPAMHPGLQTRAQMLIIAARETPALDTRN